jgi:hypothetical protein
MSARDQALSRPPGQWPAVGGVDFSVMYAAHDAFTRDLTRLSVAAAAGRAAEPSVQAGWATFARQLAVHHGAEDTLLWPPLRARATQPRETAVLDAMEAEHAQIDPLLASVEQALTGGGPELAAQAEQLSRLLAGHLRHEEDEALPLIATHLGAKGWNAFARGAARQQGLRGAAEFFPWLLDGADPAAARRLLGLLPPPVRVLHRTVWAPRYARTARWLPVS